MHHWAGTAFSGRSIGHKGMLQAAKLMSTTIIDYVLNDQLQKTIRAEFEEKVKNYKYKPIVAKK